ncbi:hypothetical protein ES705_47094 [subsurface metagenome]
MKLEKAIEILNDLLGDGPQFSADDRIDAVYLSIEALKHFQHHRNAFNDPQAYVLKGETLD